MKVIDLTHELNSSMSLFPGAELYTLEQTAFIEKDFYNEHRICLTTHLGTHMDSPNHIVATGKRLCDYNVAQFVGAGIVIDVSNLDGLISEALIKQYVDIEKAEFILFYTGHDAYYGTEKYLTSFPVLDASGVDYLAHLSSINLKGIGIDTFSIDPIEPLSIDRHVILLDAGLVIVENLTHLKQLIGTSFIFEALPLRMDKIEGSPVRAIALIL